ncbi:MAG: S41 family peptidase [Methylococcaceae bacterium]|nr:MAG: S41 family peptidase [Methylococcaceae bacterium]
MLNRNTLVTLTIGVTLGVGISLGGMATAEKAREEAAPSAIPYEDLRTFSEIYGRIRQDYVEPVSDNKLLTDAIRGMLAGLDPHSTYLDEEEYNELRVGTTGQFGGLGIEVGMENGFVKVISPIDDTPAQRAGVKAGDLIIRLDDKPVKGMTLNDAVKLMRGEPGSDIVLTVVREGLEQPLKIKLTRDIIKVKSVKNRLLEEGYGYIRITSFQSHTTENMVEAINELKKKGDLKGLVLDLRNNPGGVLNAAVAISDAFLESGLIVYTEGRIEDAKMRFSATPDDLLKGAPIVVLINSGSASASEIVAGALQDHKRAIIMGEKSFGKGSVQTILPTSTGGAIKLTTARYYTPSGRSIQAEGIVPDVVLSKVKLEAVAQSEFEPVKEADLTRHLSNGNKKSGETAPAGDKAKDKDGVKEDPLAVSDYPLNEALNLLKGISILGNGKKAGL